MKFFSLLATCLCLYKEEVGLYDWHQPHVGIVKRIAHTSDGILLATRPGIVAFLDKKANISKYQIDIEWRLQFDDSVEAIYSDRNENLILNVLDDYSHQLYSVDRNGYRNWDIKIPSSSESSKTKPKILKNDRFVFALFSDKLAKIRNGTTIYTTTINGGTEVVFGDDSLVFVVQSVNDQLLQVQPIDNDGKMLDTLDFGIIDNPDTTTIISGMGPIRYLVFETKGGPQFTRLGSKKNEILSLANIIPDHVSLIPLQSHKSLFPNCFVSVSKTKTELVCIIEDGTAKVISSFENSNLLRPRFEFNVLDKNTFVVTMVGKDKDQVYHESIVMHDGLVTRKSGYIEFNFKKSGEIQWVSVDFSNSQEYIPSIFIGTQDDSFHYLRSKKQWTMEESLTDTAASVLVDIPSNPDEPVDLYKLFNEDLKDRVLRHYGELKDFVKHLTDGGEKVENELLVSHDHHGFKKLAIFASRGGKLVAIETQKGKTVWERFFPTLQPKHIFVTRDYKSGLKPVITLISASKDSQETVSMLLDALTGKDFKSDNVTSYMKTTGVVDYAVLTEFAGEESKIKTVAFVALESSLLFPPHSEVQSKFDRKSFYYYLTPGVGSNFIHGFMGTGMVSLQTWRIDFPDGEEIAAMDVSDKSPVANVGRVLGDRRVLYKYLNPNLASVLTVKRKGKESTLYSYLIDLVSGKIHERHVHYGAGYAVGRNGGVKTMICENFVVYTFWNFGGNDTLPNTDKEVYSSPTDHYEMVVLELYQSATPDVRHDRSSYSSFDSDRLESIGFSFVVENGVSALGVTTTHAGITSREILVSFEHGILQGLSRKFLDPRRPVTALTAEQKEEGLFPYFPAMPIHGPLVITYYLQVLGIERIQSISTNLESTSVIVVSGIDIFSTKRTPSKPFDTLSSDFAYMQLVASMVVLSVAVFVTDRAVQSKSIKEAWV